jgi:hypothetical protein
MSMRIGAALLTVLVTCLMTSSALDAGNAALEWNQIALSVAASEGPIPQLRSMTIVEVAVHDAVNLITGKHPTYLSYSGAPTGASGEAAAIAAAHKTLTSLFSPQTARLDAARSASLASRGLSEADPGIAVGKSVAAAILAARATDGAAAAQFPYTAPDSGTPGVWVAIDTTPALLPGWGNVTPWVLQSASQFRPDGPPSLDSGRWARDYNEIKALGSSGSTARTDEQTQIARFWLGSPATIWNGVGRKMIEARGLDLSDTAYVLALMYLAAADASIACWDAKYVFNFWRPQHAIRSGHLDGNDETVRDPDWVPLFATPPHPEYLSGHTANSSAMATMLQFVFGDDPGLPIVAISSTNPGFPRQWTTFGEGVDEVIEARIYSGLHYRTADQAGARVGRQVAQFVFQHALR